MEKTGCFVPRSSFIKMTDDCRERSLPLKKFNITHSSPGKERHGLPCGATGGMPVFDEVVKQE